MANTRSAIKRIKTSERRRQRNAAVKSETRTYVKRARSAIGDAPSEAGAALKAAISALDVAARKGVIHANNAARRKSRLMRMLNKQVAATSTEGGATTAAPKRATRARKAAGTAKTARATGTTKTTRATGTSKTAKEDGTTTTPKAASTTRTAKTTKSTKTTT